MTGSLLSRRPSCQCGTCQKCKRRAYAREHYAKHADRIRARVKAYREANLEKIRAYDRERGYRGTPAHTLAHNRARVLDPQPCVECGTTENIERHHPDYSQPLLVVWLCRDHHRALHRKVA